MISNRFLLTIIIVLGLAACATSPEKDDTTLGSLESRSIVLEEATTTSKLGVDKAIQTYESLIGNVETGELNAKAMHRLANLEMQRLAQDSLNGEGAGDLNYDKAIHWYEKLLVTYPDYPERSEALYQLAQAYEQSSQVEKALRALKLYARDYPNSDRVAETHFRRGEMLFVERRYPEAEKAYSNVVAFGRKSKFYEQAMFKYGWAIYKQERCVDSMTPFFNILDSKLNHNIPPSEIDTLGFLSKTEKELVEEIFRVMNLCVTQYEAHAFISDYLEGKPARAFEFLLYARMAEYHMGEGRPYEAAAIYAGFYERAPWHPYALLYQDKVIDIYRSRGDKERIVPAKEEFVFRYEYMMEFWKENPHTSYFEYLVRNDKTTISRVRQSLKSHLIDLAQFHHVQAKKGVAVAAYDDAVTWYRRYLKYFPGAEDAAPVNFMLAEALNDSKKYEDAAIEFRKTAYKYGSHKQANEAGYAALIAYAEHEKRLSGTEKDEWHRQLVTAALKFAGAFRDDPRVPAVLVNVAEGFYEVKNYEEALTVAQRVIDVYPKAEKKLKRNALVVLANTHFEQERYDVAELYYEDLVALLPKGDPVYGESKKRLVASIYKQAEALKEDAALPGAIDEFKRLLRTVPDAEVRPVVEFDIATIYIMLDDWEKALEILEPFKKKYPRHELVPAVAEKVALGYLTLEKHAEAAEALVELTNTQRDAAMMRESLWKAAELYEQVGDLDNAANTYLQFAMQFPDPLEEALEAQYRTGNIYRMKNLSFNYRVQLQKIYDADQRGGGQRTDRTRFLAAQAAFELAEPLYARYARVRLVEPIRQNMKLKDQYMKQALAAYNKAADLDVAEFTTAATYRIAAMYADFSIKLMDSDRPVNLNEEELEQYELMLEEQAFPFEEQSIDLHIANTDRMADGVYNEWIKKSMKSLADFMPVRYKKRERRDAVYSSLD